MDGVGDLVDIDDDNDGVLDVMECNFQNYISSGTPFQDVTVTGYLGSRANPTSVSTLTAPGSFSWPSSAVSYTTTRVSTAENGAYELVVSKELSNVVIGSTIDISATFGATAGNSNLDTISFEVNGQVIYKDRYPASLPATISVSAETFLVNPTVAVIIKHNAANSGSLDPFISLFSYDAPTFCDTDMDGIVNSLDLDSDGDGCYDLQEATVPGHTKNGSATDSTLTSVATVGLNGLANSLEVEDSDSTGLNYNHTYFIAESAILNACADTDMDGIGDLIDIDDDNDGVLDIDEYQCFSVNFEEGQASGSSVNRMVMGIFRNELDCALYHFTSDATNATFYTDFSAAFHHLSLLNAALH